MRWFSAVPDVEAIASVALGDDQAAWTRSDSSIHKRASEYRLLFLKQMPGHADFILHAPLLAIDILSAVRYNDDYIVEKTCVPLWGEKASQLPALEWDELNAFLPVFFELRYASIHTPKPTYIDIEEWLLAQDTLLLGRFTSHTETWTETASGSHNTYRTYGFEVERVLRQNGSLPSGDTLMIHLPYASRFIALPRDAVNYFYTEPELDQRVVISVKAFEDAFTVQNSGMQPMIWHLKGDYLWARQWAIDTSSKRSQLYDVPRMLADPVIRFETFEALI